MSSSGKGAKPHLDSQVQDRLADYKTILAAEAVRRESETKRREERRRARQEKLHVNNEANRQDNVQQAVVQPEVAQQNESNNTASTTSDEPAEETQKRMAVASSTAPQPAEETDITNDLEEPLLPTAEAVDVILESPPPPATAVNDLPPIRSFSSGFCYRLAAVALVLAVAGCLGWSKVRGYNHCLETTGPVIQRELTDLAVFDCVESDLPAKVSIGLADQQRVTVQGPAEILDTLNTVVEHRGWRIRFHQNSYCGNRHVRIKIETACLDRIALLGSGDLEADFGSSSSSLEGRNNNKNKTIVSSGSGDMALNFGGNVPVVATKLLGSGSISLEGSAVDHHVSLVGSGDVRSFGFSSQNAAVVLTGSGDVDIDAKRSLRVTMVGSGDVRYTGNPPDVEKSGFGSGDVKRVDEKWEENGNQ